MVKKKSVRASAPFLYFIGIGGIGMSALARYAKHEGCRVAGSDAVESDITRSLRKEGIPVAIGQKKYNLPVRGVSMVIYNRAIRNDNPELAAARKHGLHLIPYAAALGDITRVSRTIAITGSHGKSTTTALAGLALVAAGLDPTVLVGTNLKEFGGKNVRYAKQRFKSNPYLVLEADDFAGAFWSYSPFISIVTNIDREHLDFYKNIGGVKKGFLKFIERTREDGTVILNRDDKNLYSLRSAIEKICRKNRVQVVWYSIKNPPAAKVKKIIKLPGEHNLSNAMAVFELGRVLRMYGEKISDRDTLSAIGSYEGAWRRMEYRGILPLGKQSKGVIVYDDYAHHPTEIEATLQGFRAKFPGVPLICVFQPHQAKRLQALFPEFMRAFQGTDVLILLPSYAVAGRDKANGRFTAQQLSKDIKKRYPRKMVSYLPRPTDIKKFLKSNLFSGKNCCFSACIIMMGAGDIVNYTDSLVR